MNFLFTIFIILDQVTKAFAAGRDFFFGPLHVHMVHNYALPFGLDFGRAWNFVILFVVYVVVAGVVGRWEDNTKIVKWGKAMLWAGASSNLADRLVLGYVRDFLDVKLGFVFNLADALIVIGILFIFFSKPKSGSSPNPRLSGPM